MTHIGSETEVTAAGERFTLSRYTRRLAKEMLAWVQSRLGNPLVELEGRLDGFPSSVQDALVDQAIEEAKSYRSLWSPPVLEVWQSEPGRINELALLLRKHHPQADAEALFWRLQEEHGEAYLPSKVIDCTGRMPPREEDEFDVLVEMGLVPRPPSRPQEPEDWLNVDKVLMREFHLRPWELDELTLTEIFVLCQSVADEKERQSADDALLDTSKLERARLWAMAQKKLTPSQRLRIALRVSGTT